MKKKYCFLILHLLFAFVVNVSAQTFTKADLINNFRSQLSSFTNNVVIDDAAFSVLSQDEKGLTLKGTLSVFSLSNVQAEITGTNESAIFSAGFSSGLTDQLSIDGRKIKSWLPVWMQGKMDLQKLTVSYQNTGASSSKLIVELGQPAGAALVSFQGMQISQPNLILTIEKTGGINIASATISSGLTLGSLHFSLAGVANTDANWSFNATASYIALKDLIANISSVLNTPTPELPAAFDMFTIKKALLTFNSDNQINLAGEWNWGSMEAFINQPGKQMMLALSPDNTFKFENVSPLLAPIDKIKFKDVAFIFANTSIAVNNPVGVLQNLQLNGALLPAGLSIMGTYVLPPDLPGLNGPATLTMSALLPNPISMPTLKAAMKFKNMELGNNLKFLESYIQLNPDDLELGTGMRVSARLDESGTPVIFNGMGSIAAPGTFSMLMYMEKGSRWNEPFGIKGVSISELGLDVGANVLSPLPRPVIGLAGTLQIGPFIGTAVGSINTANPIESAIAIAMNELSFKKMVDDMLSQQVKNEINKLPASAVDFSLKDALLTIVPKTTTIAGKTLNQGYQIAGTGTISNFAARINLNAGYSNGIAGEAAVAPIEIKQDNKTIFSFGGNNPADSAWMSIDFTIPNLKAGKPFIFIDGTIQLLELSNKTKVEISRSGFYLSTSGKIFNKFNASFEAKGSGRMDNGTGMEIRAAMKNDLFELLNKEAISYLDAQTKKDQDAYKKAKADLKESRDYLAKTQADVNAFNKEDDRVDKQIKAVNKLADKANDINLKKEPWRASEKGTLYASYETANGILKGYKETLKKLKDAVNWSKRTGYKSLVKLSVSIIDEYENVSTGSKAAAKWIVENGLDNFINIKSAEFSGKLNSISGAAVSMKTNVTFMSKVYNLGYNFSFSDPEAAALEIAKKLLDNKANDGSGFEFAKEFRTVQ